MSDKLFRDTFVAFDTKRTQEKGLGPVEVKAAIPGAVGIGRDPTAKKDGYGAGGGSSSDLTEQSRTYHPVQTLTSSDGIFSANIRPIKELNMSDATGKSVKWTFNTI